MSFKLNITEKMVDLIIGRIQANIKTELDGIAAERNDAQIVLSEPQSYFVFDEAIDLRCPAVYVLPTTVDFHNERGQNHINAEQMVQISIVFEAKDKNHCVRGLWRYVDAMFNTLDHWQLSSEDNRSKNVLIHAHTEYSGVKKADQQENIFRKEAMLIFKVEHWQKLND